MNNKTHILLDDIQYIEGILSQFGVYSNMTEDEIIIMLNCMRLQPVSEPVTSLDMAVLSALRCAHERYPLYEDEYLTEAETGNMLGLLERNDMGNSVWQ